MRLGLNLGYFSGASDVAGQLTLVQEAERLGYAVVWVAEAYGSDSATVLGWLAAQTSRIELGSAVLQIPARTPAATAMAAATLDVLSGGRFRLGLGVSGPQVSEGWYGVPFARPLARTREYIDVVRLALGRKPVAYEGTHFTLPLPDGAGKPLRLALHPSSDHIPLYVAAIGPRNLELAGELADGALVVFFSPGHSADLLGSVATGRRRAGRDLAGFDVAATVPVVVGDDLARCADPVRGYAALYLGGMGSREQNFYNQLAVRMGYGDAAAEVQELFLARKHREAMAAVPAEFIDDTSLIGPPERIADRIRRFADAGVTTLSVTPFGADVPERITALRTVAEAAERAGVAT